MTAFPTYSTGTVAVANGATSIIGTGTTWSGANAKPGDDIVVDGHTVVVLDVTDATHLVIDAWPYTTVSAGAAYKIIKRSPLRFAGGDAMAEVSTLVAALNTDGFYVFVASNLTEPDPSYGEDDQFAFQPSTSKLWLKTGGVWVLQGIYKGFNITGAWSGATAYAVNDVVSVSGSSYVCILAHTNHTPPNATYWVVLASKGDTGSAAWTAPAAWLTATAYVAGPPASVVTQGGETYVCLVSHTSGTFATDLAATKWIKVAAKGTDAPTYGGTSTTSLAIGTGSKVFTTQTGLAYLVGNYVRASSAANGANYMEGFITAYSGTSLTVNVTKVGGSGTLADWNFATAGAPGSGDLLSSNNLSDLANAATARGNLGVLYSHAGRLTLQSATPVMTTTQSAKTTLFWTPYNGNQGPIYDGSKMVMTASAELSAATTDTTKSPAAIGASKINDWFRWNDAGTIRLSHGPDWTNDTTRSAGTALVMVDGVLLNNASITNGPAASRGTYVGTTRSNASSQLDFILPTTHGTAGWLGLWNKYNRVDVAPRTSNNASSYNYSVAAVRQIGGSNVNQTSFVSGLDEDGVNASFHVTTTLGAVVGAYKEYYIALDSTTGTDVASSCQNGVAVAAQFCVALSHAYAPQIGFHFISANELGDGANNNATFGQKYMGLVVRLKY